MEDELFDLNDPERAQHYYLQKPLHVQPIYGLHSSSFYDILLKLSLMSFQPLFGVSSAHVQAF